MQSEADEVEAIVPATWRPELPIDRVILLEEPEALAPSMDVLFVGGGPAGLAGAIELAKLVREDAVQGGDLGAVEIGVLEKAGEFGEHCISGAVINPRSFRELFPNLTDEEFPFRGPVERERVYYLTRGRAFRVPTPPSMRNQGNRVASICEVVRWMAARAEELGVNLFPGYPVDALLVSGARVRGARTAPAGLQRDGTPGAGYVPPMDVSARVTVLAEGSRGLLTQGWLAWQGISSPNPQIYALGVKELWEVEHTLDRVIHTLGWPVPDDVFGGSFIYPMGDRLVSLGLVVGLDYPHQKLDTHGLLQELKTHDLVRRIIAGGELVEWGAKTIPEGGYHSLPERLHGDGVCVVGDAAGYVDVPSLKGIHYAVQSGILAARAIFRALRIGDTSRQSLEAYTTDVEESYVGTDLRATRNVRLSFKSGLFSGGLRAGLMLLTRGHFPRRMIRTADDAEVVRFPSAYGSDAAAPDGRFIFSKSDAVFRSGNQTRDDVPEHLILPTDEVPRELGEFYERLCPAGVYEWTERGLAVNAPNCVDCKATDVLGPRWTPREGGSGPAYRRM